jgi:hypothetical protein
MKENYSARHFEMMAQVATEFSALPAQILEHNYNPESFGSWWFTFRRKGRVYRMVFDGRDNFLSLQDAANNFHDMDSRQLKERETLVAEICSLTSQKT